MRLQNKISLAILPMVAVVISLLGGWSVFTATGSLKQAMYDGVEKELRDYVENQVAKAHRLLTTHGLDATGSFVDRYQQESFQAASRMNYYRTGHLMVIDATGVTIFCSRKGSQHRTRIWSDVARLSSRHAENYLRGILETVNGPEIYVGHHFAPWQWTLIYAVSAEELFEPGIRIRNATVVATILCALIGFLVIFFMLRRSVVEPVVKLKEAAVTIAGMKSVEEIPIYSNDEFDALARSMEKMAGAIEGYRKEKEQWQRQLETRIEETSELNKVIVDASTLGIATYEEDGRCILANEAMAKMIGATRDQCLQQNFRQIPIWEATGLLAQAVAVLSDGISRRHEVHATSSFGKEMWINCLLTRCFINAKPHLLLVLDDISTYVQMQVELELRNRALEESNRELDDFAYIASHDLREPLRGIANFSGFLMEDYAKQLGEDGRDKLQTLIRLCEREDQLIDTLLAFSRVGRTELAIEPVDLNDLIEQVLARISHMLTENTVDIRIPERLPVVSCDRIRIGEVFFNLVTNAVKYSDKEDKWIEIGYISSDTPQNSHNDSSPMGRSTAPRLYVRDNGIGIRNEHFGKIFNIFQRLHGREKFGGGIGAGLTVVKKIVERHRGRIWVESELEKGTTFYFTLSGGES